MKNLIAFFIAMKGATQYENGRKKEAEENKF